MKNKSIITLLALSTLSFASIAQESAINKQGGSVTGKLDISMTVPKMCNISNGTVVKANGSEYIKKAETTSFNLAVNCKSGASVIVGFEYGSNPNSKLEARRLPLNGEQGDVEHYLTYQIRLRHSGNPVIGDINDNPYSYSSNGTFSVLEFQVYYPANQDQLAIGQYFDTINYQIDYF